jgi:hypothetical protein
MSGNHTSTVDQAPLAQQIRRHLFFSQAKSNSLATTHDHYCALALAVRDRLLQNWVDTAETYTAKGVRTAAYLSAEYLLGPHLENNLNPDSAMGAWGAWLPASRSPWPVSNCPPSVTASATSSASSSSSSGLMVSWRAPIPGWPRETPGR